MNKRENQQAYWNSRAPLWREYSVPLLPSSEDVAFQKNLLRPGGDALILGATTELCSAASEVCGTVTAVDFAADVIEALRQESVHYINQEWGEFFDRNTQQYDNILTDGGLLCLEFPRTWQRIAKQIRASLKQGGIFSARVYISTGTSPLASYDNPNLGRFITSIAQVSQEENWTLRPEHPDYADYDVAYALPPEHEVVRTFGELALRDSFTPDYQAGEHFKSFAWQRI